MAEEYRTMKKRKDSFFGLHFDLHPKRNDTNLGADLDEENIRTLLERVRPDYVTYDCKGHEGFCGYESDVGVTSPAIQQDSLALWRKVTAELDISLGIHYSGLQDFIRARLSPNVAVQDREGRTDGKTASLFSDYPEKYMIPQLKEVARKYDVNGVWLDAECWGAQLDYSEKARAAWKEFSGSDEFPEDGAAEFEEFKCMHRLRFEEYLRGWVDALHSEFPQLDCCSNWAYTTMMPLPVRAEIANISGDFDPFLSVDRARTECRYLENTGYPWELQSWGFDIVDGQGPCRKTVAQICQEAAVVMMHGGGYMNYFLPTRGGYIPESVIKTLEEVASFVRARESFSHGSKPMYQLGVLYSTKSQLKRSPNVYTWWGNRLDELEGALHLALENQYSTTVLAEHQLKDTLPRLKCLIIADCTDMDAEYIRLVEEYVARGGKLILLAENATRLFEKIAGLHVGKTEECVTALVCGEDKIELNGIWAEAELRSARPLLYRYTGNGIVANSEYMDVREAVASSTAEIMGKHIAATINTYKKGGVVTILTDFGRRFFENHHPYLRNVFRYMVEALAVACEVEVEGSHSLDVSLRKTRNGTEVLHVMNTMNMPVGNTRKFPEEIPLSGEIGVMIRCEKPNRVVQLPEGKELEFEWKDGFVTFRSPGIHIHGAFELQK